VKNPFYNHSPWMRISRFIRFGRAVGRCEVCGVPNGMPSPNGKSILFIACAHLNGDLSDVRPENLLALCPHCHFQYDQLRRVRELRLEDSPLAAIVAPARRRNWKRNPQEIGFAHLSRGRPHARKNSPGNPKNSRSSERAPRGLRRGERAGCPRARPA
jgi:hypothetical protein